MKIELETKNPGAFVLTATDRAAVCVSCNARAVVGIFAPALTPELHQLLMERDGITSGEQFAAVAIPLIPMLTKCGACGAERRRNWQFIETPKVYADGSVQHTPVNTLDDDA